MKRLAATCSSACRWSISDSGSTGAENTYWPRMICTRKDGKTVGITANSHKVIRNVLDQVLKAA